MEHGELYVRRHGRAETLQIHFTGAESRRLDEELMACFVRKADDFVLDAGAVTRAYPMDFTGIEGRAPDIFPDDTMRFFIRIGDIAGKLWPRFQFC